MTRSSTRRSRGTALITVLIVTVGVLGMLSVLFTLGAMNTNSQSEVSRIVDMQLLLRTAVADAFDELNTGTDYDDVGVEVPSGYDGIGAIGVYDALAEGTEFTPTGDGFVPTSDDLSGLGRPLSVPTVGGQPGRTLGRYMSVVKETSPGDYVLHVVAAFPNFVTPEQLAGAQLRYSKSTQMNALTFIGRMDSMSDVVLGDPGGAPDINSAWLIVRDQGDGTVVRDLVPALGINDAGGFDSNAFKDFVEMMNRHSSSDLVGLSEHLGSPPTPTAGADLGITGPTATRYWDTVSQTGSRVPITQALVDKVRDKVLNWVSDLQSAPLADLNFCPSNAWGNTNTHFKRNHTFAGSYDPDDASATTYYHFEGNDGAWPVSLELHDGPLTGNAKTITGTGVLVIEDGGFKLKDGGTLNWTGDIIWILGSSNKEFKLEKGAQVNVTGNFFILHDPSSSGVKAKLKIDAHNGNEAERKSGLTITDGIFLAVAHGDNNIEIEVKNKNDEWGSYLHVDGLFYALGSDIKMKFGQNHDASSTGLSTPKPQTVGEQMNSVIVNGSMIIAVPTDGSTTGIQAFDWTSGVQGVLNFDDVLFNDNMDRLNGRTGGVLVPWSGDGWLETSGRAELQEILGLLVVADGDIDVSGIKQ